MISQRTRAGLQAAKARGVIVACDRKGLTDQGIEPPRGGAWSHMTVLRAKTRLAIAGKR